MTLVFVGWSSDDKVPAVVGETKFGQGKVRVGSQPWVLCVTGNKLAAGSATADQDIDDVDSDEEADALYGAGSEIARQCYAAHLIPGCSVKGAPVAESAGAVGTATITIGAAWTAEGSLEFWIGRHAISVATGASIAATVANITAAINAIPGCFCTAADASPVVNLSTRNKGPRNNEYYIKLDTSNMPTGMTCVVAGGAATTSGLVPFQNGATADTVANVIALLKMEEYDIIAPAQNDAVALALWEAHVDSEAGPLIGHLEELVVGHNGTWAAALSIAQTTLNAYRAQVVWSQYDRAHPSELAACWGAYRSVVEQTNPNPNYDGTVVPVSTGQEALDVLLHAEKKTALNNGVTPITTVNGAGVVVRSICSHSLTGALADYRCLDTTDVSVPDRIRKEIVAEGEAWMAANPYVDDDPDTDEPPRPAGTGTPTMWNARVYATLKAAEQNNWITDVESNLPTSEWDATAKRILTACPVVVRPKNHQIGISVRQQAA